MNRIATPPQSLSRARLLSRQRERAWFHDIVRFQVDDLNALYDPLCVPGGGDAAGRRRLVEKAKARMLAARSAAAWSPERYEAACWEIIQEGLDAPEDAFGPAIILTSLASLGTAARRWLASLPPRSSPR